MAQKMKISIKLVVLVLLALVGIFGVADNTHAQYFTIKASIYANSESIGEGDSTTVHWTSNGAKSCTGSDGTSGWAGSKSLSGSFLTGKMTSSETFKITCTNVAGDTDSESVTIAVGEEETSGDKPSVSISADDTSIDDGDNTRIHWTSKNADDCEASGGTSGWSGRNIGTSGSFDTGNLTSDKTFRITCTNDDSDESDADSVSIDVGGSTSNNSGRPKVEIEADDTSLASGKSAKITWDATDADECFASGGSIGWTGTKNSSGGSFNTGPLSSSVTFSINCYNEDGSTNDSVTVRVSTTGGPVTQISQAPTTVTLMTTKITTTSAELNSLIVNKGTLASQAWFEWSTNITLGNSTNRVSVAVSPSTTRKEIISGLTPGTRYYYRAVVENINGRTYGSTLNFLTNNIQTIAPAIPTPPKPTPPKPSTPTPSTPPPIPLAPAPTITPDTTIINNIVNTNSLVTLSIDGGEDNIAPEESRIYNIKWENTTDKALEKVVLRVILPSSMIFETTNKGSFTSEDNTIILDIDTLEGGEIGSMLFTLKANPNIQKEELVVVVANLVYTDEAEIQGDAVAYTTHHGFFSESALPANVLGAGFLPETIYEWLFLFILVMISLLLVRHLFFGRSPNTENQTRH